MKRKKSYLKFTLFTILVALVWMIHVPVYAQSTTPPTIDGYLDSDYLKYGRVFSYQGFYLSANATLYIIDDTSYDSTYVYIAWIIDPTFNDATYGNNRHPSWPGGHTFFDLAESDKQRLDMENDCGEVVLDVTMDLLDGPGYATVSGYDAVFNATEDSDQTYINGSDWTDMDYSTSVAYNVNTQYNNTTCDVYGSTLTDPDNGLSPPLTTPYYEDPVTPAGIIYTHADNDCWWEWRLIWEMRVERTVFAKQCTGCACTGVYKGIATNPVELHASPSKEGVSPVTTYPDPGKIGDYVWHDIDRDGLQDFNEPGFANVTVALYTDPNGDGNPADGAIIETTITDSNGYYAFLQVGEGNYVVDVTDTNGVLTGFSTTTGTTDPHGNIDLEQGGAYVDADFGYALTDSTKAVIGDFVWIDADNDGMQDAGEPGVGGVTLNLLGDIDGDNNWTDVIATTTTTDDGYYYFTGVDPGDYKVQVTDTGGVLTGYTLVTIGQSSVNPTPVIRVAAGDAYLNADFGYYKATGLYSIGNQVWLEYDKAGRPPLAGEDPEAGHGEYESTKATDTGIADVTLNLFKDSDGDGVRDANERVIATTTTASDGTYSFNGLPPGDYLVEVSDINNILEDYIKSLYYYDEPDPIFGTAGDPTTDPTVDNYSKREAFAVTITNANNTTADFGYWIDRSDDTPGAVGDFVWYDLDGDGVQDPDEPGIEGVLVELWALKKTGGTWGEDGKLGETYTDVNGYNLFRNLPVGSGSNKPVRYRIKVLASNWDTGGPLEGFTAIPTNLPANQDDSVDLYDGGTTVDLTLDFGYYFGTSGTTYSIGDYIWLDTDEDGVQDAGETGIADVTLALYIDSDGDGVIDSGEPLIATDTTDASGNYLFSGLGNNDYIVQITDNNNVLAGYYSTYTYNSLGIPTPVTINGSSNLNIDYGFNSSRRYPTPVFLSSFHAYNQGGQVVVHWETASENGTAGFYLLRQDGPGSQRYLQVNKNFLPGLLHSHQGGIYRYVDIDAYPGKTYTYKLVEVEFNGEKSVYGPFRVTVGPPPPEIDIEPLRDIYSKKAHKDFSRDKAARIQAMQLDRQTAENNRKSRVGDEAKITVKEKGLYYLDTASIANMLGMTPKQVEQRIKNNQFLLANRGNQIAYHPADGDTGIYFYGEALDSLYTEENVYWLEKGKGTVMLSVYGGMPSPTGGMETFTDTLHIEEDHFALTALATEPSDDYWMWDYVVADTSAKSFYFYVPGAAASGTASLTLYLQGATNTTADPDHHVEVSLNGTYIGEGQWEGKNTHQFTVSFDQSLLMDGQNTVEISGILDSEVPYSIFYVNAFDLDYQRYYRAVNDMLFCRGSGNPVITIDGFTGSGIQVFDITDPVQPVRVTGTTIDSSYRVSFVPDSPETTYLAVNYNGVQTPVSVFADKASDLKKNGNNADYIVITPPGLEDDVVGLTTLRQASGLETMVVELEDIYDEFNYGISSPEAIKEFLSYAYQNWNKNGPEYVVLAGEGTFDYKNRLGYSDNLIPPMLVGTPYGLFASDNWFVDVVGNDGVAEMAIGRLPVMTAVELLAYIDKLTDYENAGGLWTNQVIMLADNPDDGGNFPVDSNYLANQFPGYTVKTVHLPDYPTAAEARQEFLEAFNNGAVLVNYIGHASLDRLASEKLLWTGDVSSLENGDKLPLITAMTCLVGRFALPGVDSLSEELVLKSHGGAVAVWAPTGPSLNSLAAILAEKFFIAAFQAQEKTVGKALQQAMQDYAAADGAPFMLRIYNLLGDPALEIK